MLQGLIADTYFCFPLIHWQNLTRLYSSAIQPLIFAYRLVQKILPRKWSLLTGFMAYLTMNIHS